MKTIKIIFNIIAIIILLLVAYLIGSGKATQANILCAESYSQNCPAYSVQECNNAQGKTIYSVAFSCTDVPLKIFDSHFKYVATCGGMPLVSGGQYKSSPLCDQTTNCVKKVACKFF